MFSFDLKELHISTYLWFYGSLFKLRGTKTLNAVSPYLVLTLGMQSRHESEDLSG